MEKTLEARWGFLIISLIFLIIAIVMTFTYINENKYFVDAKAIVTKVSYEDYYNPDSEQMENEWFTHIKYVVDGNEYTARLEYYDATLLSGEEIDIVYDSRKPSEVQKSRTSVILVASMYSLCLVFVVVSVVLHIKKKREFEW